MASQALFAILCGMIRTAIQVKTEQQQPFNALVVAKERFNMYLLVDMELHIGKRWLLYKKMSIVL
jgi:hypothetical protein